MAFLQNSINRISLCCVSGRFLIIIIIRRLLIQFTRAIYKVPYYNTQCNLQKLLSTHHHIARMYWTKKAVISAFLTERQVLLRPGRLKLSTNYNNNAKRTYINNRNLQTKVKCSITEKQRQQKQVCIRNVIYINTDILNTCYGKEMITWRSKNRRMYQRSTWRRHPNNKKYKYMCMCKQTGQSIQQSYYED